MVASFACGVIILLFMLSITLKNTETQRYEETVEMLMHKEGLSSAEEADERFPILIEIRAMMTRIDDLNKRVHRKAHSPAPIISQEESLQLTQAMQRVRQLRHGVKTGLAQLLASYAEGQL